VGKRLIEEKGKGSSEREEPHVKIACIPSVTNLESYY